MSTPPPGASVHLGGEAWAHPDLEADLVSIGSVVPWPGNPRRGDQPAITSSVRDHGLYAGVVVQASTGRIVVGNHRRHALMDLGATMIPRKRVDVDDTRAAAIVARDNRTSDLGGYDDVELAELLAPLAEDELLDLAGYDEEAYAALLEAIDPSEPLPPEDEDLPLPLPVNPISVDGDVWEMGQHRLVVGNSRDSATYDKLLDGALVGAVWTDPPYGVDYVGGTGKTIKNDDAAGLPDLLRDALGEAYERTQVGGAWYVAYADKAGSVLPFLTVLHRLGVYRQNLVWVKDSLVLSQGDYHSRYEPIAYGWKPGKARRQPVEDRTQTTVWEIPRPKRSKEHPTMKPVELVARALRNSTKPDDLVLDPFGGSGTTLIACHQEGRAARLIELDPAYADVICRRYQHLTGQLPVRNGVPVDFLAAA